MNIYKIAQGNGGIPDGMVEVEITIDENGNYEPKIVGHGGGTSCSESDDEAIINEIKLGEMVDDGKTGEYWNDKKKKQKMQAPPVKAKPKEFIGGVFGPKVKQKEKEKDMTGGFGV